MQRTADTQAEHLRASSQWRGLKTGWLYNGWDGKDGIPIQATRLCGDEIPVRASRVD